MKPCMVARNVLPSIWLLLSAVHLSVMMAIPGCVRSLLAFFCHAGGAVETLLALVFAAVLKGPQLSLSVRLARLCGFWGDHDCLCGVPWQAVVSIARGALQAIPSHPIPSHPIPSHPIPSHPIPSHPIPSHPIPSHPIHPWLFTSLILWHVLLQDKVTFPFF